ncbi:MAG: GEVED domain-containing protein [Bacteroidota bacterium]|nr:GEVED domain-containing protein [Bacteroidota bacterium]MDP3147261.1 GEVED domain-containing protein [Bacteroidota bacterium]
MRKILLAILALTTFTYTSTKAQIYLTEGFENPFTGTPAAPTGWTQTQLVLIGDGIPEASTTTGEKDWEQNINIGPATWSTTATSGVYPNAAATGSAALFMNDANFGFNGLGNRTMKSPVVNLAASTNPYVRFKMFFSATTNNLQFRVMASNDGGTTWAPIMSVYPNAGVVGVMTSATPWEPVNVKIPAIYKVANAKFALEFTPSNGFNSLLFIDDFSVEEFTPTTITSAASGAWSLPATWVGGIVPNADNNVIIAPTHTVIMNMNVERVQDLTLSGGLNYSTTTAAHVLQVLNNFSITSTGSYTSGTGTLGKRTYVGANFVNAGIANFANGTSATGALFWTGYTGSYSGAGTLTSGRIPIVSHICAGGVQYLNPVTVSNGIDLILGTVNVTNLTLGNPGLSTTFTTNRAFGIFSGPPTFNNTNITARNLNYVTAYATNNVYYVDAPQNIIPGEEIQLVSGIRNVTGTLGMNTYNNLQLNYPILVGTTTTGGLTLTRGIIITSTLNLLTLNTFVAGVVGTLPSTVITTGTTAGNHGSFVSGPIRTFFPATGTVNRNFPLGVGTAFHNNSPSSNLRRYITLGAGGLAWGSQTITATIENAPSGTPNPTLTTVMGSRAYRLNTNGGPGLGLNNTVLLTYDNTTYGPTDNLIGFNQDLRIAQAAALTGPWTERSLSTGTGLIQQNTPGTRVTTSLTPGPINNGDQYFAWATTSTFCSGAPASNSVVTNATVVCLNGSANLSLANTYTEIALTYQWSAATSSVGPYSPVSSATLSTYSPTNITVATWYQCVITCTNGPASTTATPVQVLVGGNACQCTAYCASAGSFAADDEIFNVSIGTLNNTSSCAQTGGPTSTLSLYSNYTGIVAAPNLIAGNNYSLDVTVGQCDGFAYSGGVTVYMDFNNNGSFADPGEQVFASASTLWAVAGTQVSTVITIPTTASNGITRMRVIAEESNTGTLPCAIYNWGETEDYCINIIAPVACVGAPSANSAVTSATNVCPNGSANLSLATSYTTGGLTYQWSTATSSVGPYSAVAGATTSIYTFTNITVATWYQCVITCTNGPASTTSTPIQVLVGGSSCQCAAYCASAASFAADDEIFNVSIGTLNNTSNCSQTGGPTSTLSLYSNYAGIISAPNLSTGSNYTLDVTVGQCDGFAYSGGVTVYMDFNQNGSFADPGEQVFVSPSTLWAVAGTLVSTVITIPASATLGTTRMRVIAEESNTGTLPCAIYNWGETEDYCINIVPGCTTPTVILTASQPSICSGNSVNLTATGATSYTWNTTATTNSISVTPSVTTSYTVIGENTPGCSDTQTVTITVDPTPTISVTSSPGLTLCPGFSTTLTASSSVNDYTWSPGNFTTAAISVTPAISTVYNVATTSSLGCTTNTNVTVFVVVCTGLLNNTTLENVTFIYPNPNTGLFTIETNNLSIKTIEVMDLTGRVLTSSNTSSDKVDFDINRFANGIYYVKIQSNNSVEVYKIIKQ